MNELLSSLTPLFLDLNLWFPWLILRVFSLVNIKHPRGRIKQQKLPLCVLSCSVVSDSATP